MSDATCHQSVLVIMLAFYGDLGVIPVIKHKENFTKEGLVSAEAIM